MGTSFGRLAAFAARAQKTHADMRASYEAMQKADRRELALRDLSEAARQGLDKGPAQDGLLEGGEWGFELSDIDVGQIPTLLWHGSADTDVPVAVGRYVAEHINGCEATIIAGESHTLLRRHWQNILARIVSTAAARRSQGAAAARSLL